MARIAVNLISETTFIDRLTGPYIAFRDCIELLKNQTDIDVHINSDKRCDIIHSHTCSPYFFYKKLRSRSKKTIITAHTIPETAIKTTAGAERSMWFIKWYFRKLFNFADVTIAVSPSVVDSLIKLKVASSIVTIPNPLRRDKFYPSLALREKGRLKWEIPAKQKTVLAVGQLVERKGITTFLEVARRLSHLLFLWVGYIPALAYDAGNLKKMLQKAPSNVRFLGKIPPSDMPLVYNAADVFLHSAYQETCGLVILEAAACELPVVIRNNPEYRTLFTADYIACKSTAEFVSWVDLLATCEKTRVYYVNQSQLLSRAFSSERIVNAWLDLYRSLV